MSKMSSSSTFRTCAVVFTLIATVASGWSEDEAGKLRKEAQDLREKGKELHQQALKEIEAADAKQEDSEKDFKEAGIREHKADELQKVTPEKQRATAMRHKAHEEERNADSMMAAAKRHTQKSAQLEKTAAEAQDMINDFKGKSSDADELKLIQEDAAENKKHAAAESAEAKRLEESAAKMKKSAADLLAQADKIDPENKGKK